MPVHLEREIEILKNKLLTLGAMVEQNLNRAIIAVTDRNEELAKEALLKDDEIDDLEVEVEETCLKIMALNQPVATDLRFVVSALKINSDLELVGDAACSIAKRAIYFCQHKPVSIPFDYTKMATKTKAMLKKSLDALISLDAKMAKELIKDDDEVDAINKQMYYQVFEAIKKNPEEVESLIYYLQISGHLERTADLATNIAEDVIYLVEAKIMRHKNYR